MYDHEKWICISLIIETIIYVFILNNLILEVFIYMLQYCIANKLLIKEIIYFYPDSSAIEGSQEKFDAFSFQLINHINIKTGKFSYFLFCMYHL